MVIASIALARTEVANKKTHISNNHLLVINPYADFMTKTSIRKFALELRYSNMIIVARITFIYQWLLSNFSFLQNGKKFHQRQHWSYEKNLHKRSARWRLQCVKKMIGYRRSSEMIRYKPAGHASKLTKILRASPQRNFKLDKEKAPMAQPHRTKLQGENITNKNDGYTAELPMTNIQPGLMAAKWIFKRPGRYLYRGDAHHSNHQFHQESRASMTTILDITTNLEHLQIDPANLVQRKE